MTYEALPWYKETVTGGASLGKDASREEQDRLA
jgi:hypothetical protein